MRLDVLLLLACAASVQADTCSNGEVMQVEQLFGDTADALVIRFASRPKSIIIELPDCIDSSKLILRDCVEAVTTPNTSCSTAGMSNPLELRLSADCFASGENTAD